MRRSASIVFFSLFAAILLTAFSPVRSDADIFPQNVWTFRAKPDVARDSIVFLNGLILIRSSDNKLFLIDKTTGKLNWVFGFYDHVDVYPVDDSMLIAVCGRTIHRLDLSARRKVWTASLAKPEYDEILISVNSSTIAIRYGKDLYETFDATDGKSNGKSENLDGDFKSLSTRTAPVMKADLLGKGSSLKIDGANAVFTPVEGQTGWTFQSEKTLAPTALFFQELLLLVDETGAVLLLNPANGELKCKTQLTDIIDMRFWDEKPENIDNYSNAGLTAVGEFLYVTGPSSLTEIKLNRFPAEISLKKSEGNTDSTPNWALDHAIKQWDGKNYQQSVAMLGSVTTTWPDFAPGHLFMGMAYSSTEHVDEAITELEKAHSLDPENPDIVSNLAGNYMLKILKLDPDLQLSDIIGLYNKIRGLQPTSAVAYVGMAEIYLGRREFDKAIAVVQDSFNYAFRGPGVNSLLLGVYYMDDRHSDILSLADKMIRLFPDSDIPFLLKGKTLCKVGQYKKAAATFAAAPKRNNESEVSVYPRLLTAGAMFFHGNAIGLYGDYTGGIKVLSNYVNSIPTLAQIEKVKQQEETARTGQKDTSPIDENLIGKSYLELNAEREFLLPALLSIAHFQNRLGEKEKSRKTLKRIIDFGSADAETLSYVGYIMALNGQDLDRAGYYVKSALGTNPEDPIFLRNYAVYLFRTKKYKTAEETFKKALQINMRTELLHYEYGILLLETGRRKEAADQFKEELRQTPDLDLARKELNRLSYSSGKKK
jgi:tetratricopeptide (TPR) repeat protein